MDKIVAIRNDYFSTLDGYAKEISAFYLNGEMISKRILKVLHALYESSKLETYKTDDFLTAYHNPVTSDFEFFLSRILYHISHTKKCDYKILLRKQEKKCAPDIRIELDGETVYVIEIKVKVGWMQELFSKERLKHDIERYENGAKIRNPKKRLEEVVYQFEKYSEVFNIDKSNVFVLVASLSNVHRKKYGDVEALKYKRTFSEHTDMDLNNLVVLSNNLNINISEESNADLYDASNDFEMMLDRIFKTKF